MTGKTINYYDHKAFDCLLVPDSLFRVNKITNRSPNQEIGAHKSRNGGTQEKLKKIVQTDRATIITFLRTVKTSNSQNDKSAA